MKKGILFLLLLVSCVTVWGQAPPIVSMNGFTCMESFVFLDDVYKTADGGFLLMGVTTCDTVVLPNGYGRDVVLMKLDSFLNVDWIRAYGGGYLMSPHSFVKNDDGSFYIVTYHHTPPGGQPIQISTIYGNTDVWIVKVDSLGNILWENSYGGSAADQLTDVVQLPNSGLLCYGTSGSEDFDLDTLPPPGSSNDYHWFFEIDSSGAITYNTRTLPDENVLYTIESAIPVDSGLLIYGTRYNNGVLEYTLATFDYNFNLVEQHYVFATDSIFLRIQGNAGRPEILVDDDGNFVLFGDMNGRDTYLPNYGTQTWGSNDIYLIKIDHNQNIVWARNYGGSEGEVAYGAVLLNDGGYLISGSTESFDHDLFGVRDSARYDYDNWLLRVDSVGDVVWSKAIGGTTIGSWNNSYGPVAFDDQGYGYLFTSTEDSDGDFYDFYQANNPDTLTYYSVFMQFPLDFIPGYIDGRLYLETDSNCVKDSLDSELHGNKLVRLNSPYPAYIYTDSLGQFRKYTTVAGTYSFSPVFNNLTDVFLDLGCDSVKNITVATNALTDTVYTEFAVTQHMCSALSISVSVDRRRSCFTGVTTIEYCNFGTVDTTDVSVLLELPPYVYVIGTSNAYTTDSSGYLVFDIDTLKAGDCGIITVNDSVACDFHLSGLPTCTKAWIAPINYCYNELVQPNAELWDSSEVKVSAQCDTATSNVTFAVTCNGTSMSSQQEYRILTYRGNLLSDSFQLNANDTMFVVMTNAGYYLRFEADNTPGHPFVKTVFAESLGCPVANPQHSNRTPLPTYDDNVAVDFDCGVIRSGSDPNDKQVTPSGITSSNYVLPSTLLEYKIRFQNTGNDTAYRVEVIDTLSEYLDLTSLQLGVSSHPYEFFVDGSTVPVLHWVYNNINLVDSNTNEPLSHGYFKFKIAPKANTPELTRIENFADIYFDFNPPVRTNTPFVTLKEEYPEANDTVVVIVDGDTLYNSVSIVSIEPQFNIYPNPYNGREFVVDYKGIEQTNIELYTLTGKLIQTERLAQGQTTIETNLQNGFYFYRIVSDGQLLKSGKLLVIE